MRVRLVTLGARRLGQTWKPIVRAVLDLDERDERLAVGEQTPGACAICTLI